MTRYGTTLREAIEAADTSRRKLSYALAEKTDNKQDSEYRALGKYLRGDETPSPERAAILAVLLGQPELALVSSPRRDRLAELAATVDRLETALGGALTRLEALEANAQPRRRRGGEGR
jgi:hypothetical protein